MKDAELKKKIEEWGDLKWKLNSLEAEIKKEILSRQETVKHSGVVAKFSNGRGKYDYETAIARSRSSRKAEILKECQVVTTDFRRACQMLGMEEERMNEYYTPGKPSAKVELM